MSGKALRPETLAAKALGANAEHSLDAATGAIVPPIHVATTYARDASYALIAGRDYTRDRNPTQRPAEQVLAALEGGEDAMVWSSGLAAATAVFRTLLSPGAHVVAPRVMYFGLRAWLVQFCATWQVTLDLVDMTDLDAVSRALRPGATRLVWLETPANPTWAVTDIAATAELAHRAGALVVVDSTCATPVHTRPLVLGADLVMHSATKYLGGHSDVLAGALVTSRRDDVWAQLGSTRRHEGAVLGPFEAYLLLRGMRTLYARVERQSRTALSLAQRLAELPQLTVLYPGLPDHPQHAIAARQMHGGFGGMLSIRVPGDPIRVIQRMRVWVPATSLGGVESLVEHRASVEGPDSPTARDLLRLSVGLEHEDDLLDDLVEAVLP
jgi:cystathionine gamma-synthase